MPSPKLNEEQAQRQREAMLGNDWNEGLKTDEAKEKALKSYCEHLSSGKSARSWNYEDQEGNHCCYRTMETKIKNKEFPIHVIEKAKSAQYSWWEDLGIRMSSGSFKGSPITFIAFMRNMFDWDKRDDTVTKLQDVIIALKSPDQKTVNEEKA